MSVQILIGDCRIRMKELPDASVDSVVCDPPYHLTSIVKRFGSPNAAPAKVGKTGAYARHSTGFMGCVWDGGDVAFQPETWAEVLRVLKPGGHLVAFSGTRTYHRMVCAIEDAGFEIRDQLAWVYGSGFPKSLNVSTAIDKQRDDAAHGLAVGTWLKTQRETRGLKQKDVAALWPSVTGGMTGCVANWETLGKVPKWDQWLKLKDFIGFGDEMDAEVWRLNGRKGKPGEAWQTAEVIGVKEGAMSGWAMDGSTKFVDREVRAANSEAAKQWQGWGTALKPSWEPICLARKPLSEGSVAANVLRFGTGAINVDACRISTDAEQPSGRSSEKVGRGLGDDQLRGLRETNQEVEEPTSASEVGDNMRPGLPQSNDERAEQSKLEEWGLVRHTDGLPPSECGSHVFGGSGADAEADATRLLRTQAGDSSLFGPSAEARRACSPPQRGQERQPPRKPGTDGLGGALPRASDTRGVRAEGEWLHAKEAGTHQAGFGDSGSAARFFYTAKATSAERGEGNNHPTVKPIALMRWLVRLVTPPNGTVLDPFAGSGSTLIAADAEQFNAIGIELSPDYAAIAEARVREAAGLFADVRAA